MVQEPESSVELLSLSELYSRSVESVYLLPAAELDALRSFEVRATLQQHGNDSMPTPLSNPANRSKVLEMEILREGRRQQYPIKLWSHC